MPAKTTPAKSTPSTAPPVAPKCGSFPRALNPSGDCCFVPNHLDSDLLKNCTAAAAKKYNRTENATVLKEVEDCYTTGTKLVVKLEFKKDIARKLYENNTLQHTKHLGSNPWLTFVDDSLKLCEWSNGKLKDFYKCMTNNLIEHCPWSAIVSSDACDAVDKFYESCAEVDTATYCKEWPIRLVMPEFCCDHPEIISQAVIAGCAEECSAQATHTEKAACNYECYYRKANVKQGGKFDFEAVKKVLMANANKTSSWDKAIDKAVDFCKPLVEGEVSESSMIIF